MNNLLDFVDFIEYTRKARDPGPRKYLRDYSNPFEKYNVYEFYGRYRFTPNIIKNVLVPILEPHLRRPSRRGLPFAPEVMLLVTLRYYATGSLQQLGEDVVNICQQSMSRIIKVVSTVLANYMKNIVRFPPSLELPHIKENFFNIANFPDVIGCIDCTHIKIKNPGGATAEAYKNRNGWFSIKVQAVTGPNLEFFDVVVRWPGGTHDNYIFNSSSVKQRLLTNELSGILLGDSGYAVSQILMTPYVAPTSEVQKKYNTSHIKTRNTVERAFSVWKQRFPCLQVGMALKLETTVAVICACAALHNLSILHDQQLFDEVIVESVDENDIEHNEDNNDGDGVMAREDLALRFFND